MGIKYTEQSRIFKSFRAIPYSDFYNLIRFYERYEDGIADLPLDEYLVIAYYCSNALFETGEYEEYISWANKILEYSIIHNVQYIDGEDIYLCTLRQKTFAHFKLNQIEKATKLAHQLIKITPASKKHSRLLRKCLRKQRPRWIDNFLVAGVGLIFIGALISIARILLIEAFYPNLLSFISVLEGLFWSIGIAGFVASAFGRYYYVGKHVKAVTKEAHLELEKSEEVVLFES
ncbi:MAG: hypothetical protein GY810_20680 [Aureispira sp.]|nr:hypothetical protein [Aureispira sp.]